MVPQILKIHMASPGTEAMAVFNTVARFNHSCVPNVHNSWNMETKTETLYAVARLLHFVVVLVG